MKIRTGFVSNSSSQSFIIRGIKINKDIIRNAWKNVEIDVGEKGDSNFYAYEREAEKRNLDLDDTKNFFDGDETDDCIIGKNIGELADGYYVEIPQCSDNEIMAELVKNGLVNDSYPYSPDRLKTFVKFISNDNY